MNDPRTRPKWLDHVDLRQWFSGQPIERRIIIHRFANKQQPRNFNLCQL